MPRSSDDWTPTPPSDEKLREALRYFDRIIDLITGEPNADKKTVHADITPDRPARRGNRGLTRADETTWPFETMVFKEVGATGQYHEPHATEQEAEERHSAICAMIREGTLEIGRGVKGEWGTPSTTPEEWNARKTS